MSRLFYERTIYKNYQHGSKLKMCLLINSKLHKSRNLGYYIISYQNDFDQGNEATSSLCLVLKNARLSYGCASNTSLCVHLDERKGFGYKSLGAHLIL